MPSSEASKCLVGSRPNAWLGKALCYRDGVPYQRRIVDDLLDEVFPELAAVALEGAKGVGKTATGMQRANSVLSLDETAQREVLTADLDSITALPEPVLIDEWQLLPEVWDRVRRAVDDDPRGGRFILTGSAELARGVRVHSGAGRIVSVRMRPLSWAERRPADASVSMSRLLAAEAGPLAGESDARLSDYTDEILASGFPGLRALSPRAGALQLDSYVVRIVQRELVDAGLKVRRPDALRSWLTAYAAATSTDASYATILDAATPGVAEKPSRATVDTYREHLTRLYVLDPLPAWTPAFNPIKRLTLSAKHHLVDPALAARLVGVGRAGLLQGQGGRAPGATGTWLGALFESLVAQSVRVYADAVAARVFHLRTKQTDREVDLIVEGDDRRVLAIEVKLSASVTDQDVRHLNWLHQQLGEQVVDRVVITTGRTAYRRRDGVAVIPFALLGP